MKIGSGRIWLSAQTPKIDQNLLKPNRFIYAIWQVITVLPEWCAFLANIDKKLTAK